MFKSITSTLNRVAASVELRNQEEMLRIQSELATLNQRNEIDLAKRLCKIGAEKKQLEIASEESGIDYLAMARNILKD